MHEISKSCLHCDCQVIYDKENGKWKHTDPRHDESCECCNADY
jgi:hypothetical protein